MARKTRQREFFFKGLLRLEMYLIQQGSTPIKKARFALRRMGWDDDILSMAHHVEAEPCGRAINYPARTGACSKSRPRFKTADPETFPSNE
jgi:hypothetical protein